MLKLNWKGIFKSTGTIAGATIVLSIILLFCAIVLSLLCFLGPSQSLALCFTNWAHWVFSVNHLLTIWLILLAVSLIMIIRIVKQEKEPLTLTDLVFVAIVETLFSVCQVKRFARLAQSIQSNRQP